MKLTFKKTLLICALPLLLTACDSDDKAELATDIAAKAPKTVLEGTWVSHDSGTEDNKIDTYTCTDTYNFKGLRLTQSIDCSSTNGDKSKASTAAVFSIGETDQDSTQIDVTFKTQSGYWTENHVRKEINNDSLYDDEHPELGKEINGKVELGLFKIENDKILKFAIDDEYRDIDRGEEKSVRPVDVNNDYIQLTKK